MSSLEDLNEKVYFLFNGEVYQWLPKHPTNPTTKFEFCLTRYPFVKAKLRDNTDSDIEFHIKASEVEAYWVE